MPPQDRSHRPGSRPLEMPDEETMLAALRTFQPAPGERFYKRMADAPWNAAPEHSTQSARRRWLRPAFAAPVILTIIIFLLFVLAPPNLRATAQRVADFFIRADSDLTSVEITPVGPGQLDYEFNQTLAEVEAAAGFPVQMPQELPPNLAFNGAVYVTALESVFLDFRTEDAQQILRITQQQIAENEQYVSIGANAEIELVQIGDAVGEYVMGGWKLPALATPLEFAAPGVKITLEAEWNSEGQIQILRWQEGNMLFEILSVSALSATATGLSKADLLALAAGMQ